MTKYQICISSSNSDIIVRKKASIIQYQYIREPSVKESRRIGPQRATYDHGGYSSYFASFVEKRCFELGEKNILREITRGWLALTQE